MNPNWLGVLSAILACAAVPVTYWAAKGRPLKTRLWFVGGALIAALPGASFGFHYLHVFPEMSWYYDFRSFPGTELLLVFIGIAGGLAATLLPRLLFMLPLLGVAVLSMVPFCKPFIGPIGDGELRDQWDAEICLQSTPSTCGVASTATILRHFGVKASEAELAVEAHSYSGGTEAWYLARAVRSRGFAVEFSIGTGFSPTIGLPAIVGVRMGTVGHFIPVLGRVGEKYLIGDPLHGRELLTLEELRQRYSFTGFQMRITSKG